MHAKSPFPGRPFREDDYKYFFGRAEVLSELKRRICARRLVGLHGAPNVGKTSLLMAGLLPQLETQGYKGMEGLKWKTTGLVVGHNPIEQLVAAIAKRNILHPDSKPTPQYQDRIRRVVRASDEGLIEAYRQSDSIDDHNLLIFMDQFETFLEGDPTPEKQQFVQLILRASEDDDTALYFVIATRSPALSQLQKYPGLKAMMDAGAFQLYPMGQRELVHAIRKPLAAVRQQIEDDLLMTLVESLSEVEDQMSKLQTTMYRTWYVWLDEGARGPLGMKHYRKAMKIKEPIGSLRTQEKEKPRIKARPADETPKQRQPELVSRPPETPPVAGHPGDEVYGKLGAQEKAISESVFKALVKKNTYTENKFMSRPSMVETLAGLAGVSVEKLLSGIQAFREQKLIKPFEGELDAFSSLEIGSDNLWEQWLSLKKWIQAETKDASVLIKLDKAAEKRENDDSAPLLSGSELKEVNAWHARFKPSTVWAEQYIFDAERPFEFLKQSLKAAGQPTSQPVSKPKAPSRPKPDNPDKRPQIKIGGSKEKDTPASDPPGEQRPKISIKSRKKS